MKIEIIGSRGYPFSYASAEDMVRQFAPRLVRYGHSVVIHGWAGYDDSIKNKKTDVIDGIIRKFHKTPGGKISGQFVVALKSSISAALSDCDIVFYIFVNSSIFSWIPKIFGKKIFTNVDGIMWKDPKWPKGIRHLFFPLASYFSIFIGKAITDSYHMQQLYKNIFKVNVDWIGYGCDTSITKKEDIDLNRTYPQGYYLIVSRITPHNLTDLMVKGFIEANTKYNLVVAEHTPNNSWFSNLLEYSKNKNVTFLGLVKDQKYLTQIIINARAYLHGHSLGGINPALVRVTSMDVPAICVDTIFNREVVQNPNDELHCLLFQPNIDSISQSIKIFEEEKDKLEKKAKTLGKYVRNNMSWETIYSQYLCHWKNMLKV